MISISQIYVYKKNLGRKYVKMFIMLILWGLVSQVIFFPTSFVFSVISIFPIVTRYHQGEKNLEISPYTSPTLTNPAHT